MGESQDFGESTFVSRASGPIDQQRLRLVLMTGTGGVLEFDLSGEADYTVGRSANAEIQVQSGSISRAHALLSVGADHVVVRDLDSTNGTYVNGTRLTGSPVELRLGDAIRFGDVFGQLRGNQVTRSMLARKLSVDAFTRQLAEEADRCIRYGRSLAVIAISLAPTATDAAAMVVQAVRAGLRELDAVTVRAPARIDALIVESTRDDGHAVAERLAGALRERRLDARLGVAAFPDDVSSADSVLLAAELAMNGAAVGAVGVARDGARILAVGSREIVVAEPAMARLYGLIERVAAAPLPVLVHGETGSGKELVAEALHGFGPRAQGPLVKLNCAAMPEQLLESELFGYERGAFSGADRPKPGLYEQADGGTLFLDEIGEMLPALQAKLLRVLEDGRVRRLGATVDRTVDVRIVAATHVDLQAAVAKGAFRQDLYYRLSAIRLDVPPLRERPRELLLLAERFVSAAAAAAGRPGVSLTSSAKAAVTAYHWPGNVRELQNAMSAAVVLCDGDMLDVTQLPPEVAGGAEASPERPVSEDTGRVVLPASDEDFRPIEDEIRELERQRMEAALLATGHNQTRAAKLIGMPLRTFQAKVKQYGLRRPRP